METEATVMEIREALSIKVVDGVRFIGVMARVMGERRLTAYEWFCAYLTGWADGRRQAGFPESPLLTVTCPHEVTVEFRTVSDIPTEDTHMPCEHDCWAIQYGNGR